MKPIDDTIYGYIFKSTPKRKRQSELNNEKTITVCSKIGWAVQIVYM